MDLTKQIQNVTIDQADWSMNYIEQGIEKNDIESIRFGINYLIAWCKDTNNHLKHGIWN